MSTPERAVHPPVTVRRRPALVSRVVLAALFAYAALAKMSSGTGNSLESLPDWLQWTVHPTTQWVVIVAELIVAVLLLSVGWFLGLCLAGAMATAFGFFVLLLHHLRVDVARCGCLGSQPLDYGTHVALLVGILLLVCSGLVGAGRASAED